MKKVSFCIPCYNEEKNIQLVYHELNKIMKELPQYKYEIIFEDNASTDNTVYELKKLAELDKNVKIIINTRNFGPARSGKNCCFNASGDVLISIACDLQNPVSLVPMFLDNWEAGHLVVMGQKIKSKERKIKYFLRTIYYKIIETFSDIPQYSHITGFGAIDAMVYKKIYDMHEPDMSIRHLLADLGYEIKLIPYEQDKRKFGKSSYNIKRSFDFAITSLINTSRFPLRFITLFGLFSLLLNSTLGILYLLYNIIFEKSFNLGFVLIFLGMFFISTLQLFFLGIIGEYLSVILNKVTIRETVIEKERINFTDEILIKDKQF